MSQIRRFKEIDDFTEALDINVEKKFPDFLIYDCEKINTDNFDRLSTYRQGYFEITLDLATGCNSLIDQFKLPSARNRLSLISPHRLLTLQPHTEPEQEHKGYSIFYKPEFIQAGSTNSNFLKDFPFFSHRNIPAISLGNESISLFKDLIGKIKQEYDANNSSSRQIIKNYLEILLLKARQNYSDLAEEVKQVSRKQEIYDEFNGLVQRHALEMRSVRAYADKMHITPKHLSEMVKKVTGQGALEAIHQTQLNYAKALLRQTSKTVSEIAYELNFDNPEYFSVFFKRLSGESPSQFRVS